VILAEHSEEEAQAEGRNVRRAVEGAPAWVGVAPEGAVDAVAKSQGSYIVTSPEVNMGSAIARCRLVVIAVAALWISLSSLTPCRAQAPEQRTFTSSKDAVNALVQAVREGDDAALQSILGPESEQIISSGDAVADKKTRDRFVADFETKHSLVKSGPHELTLNIGATDWPLPIPLVHANNKWFWNAVAGKDEILYRRIGRNELSAINVCKGIVAAQHEYASAGHDGQPPGKYAPRLVSESGKQNGLYWPVAAGATPSPAGPLLAQANAEGYDPTGRRAPYHGYYYRMLNKPGGFGFLAYPAEYRSSGVMTFIVDQTGSIYQKDLGEKTADIAPQITDYRRDSTWTRVE
jgi:Protein of unknown function (DUF2950)